MTEAQDSLTPLLEPLIAVRRLLAAFNDRGVIIGDVAASLLGKPRLTADIDAMLLLSVDDIPRLINAARTEGIIPRIEDADDFARKHRIVLLRHLESGINIDISLGSLPFEEEVVQRSFIYQIGSISIRLPTPEDLIILKAVAHRSKDLEDIQTIINNHPNLDLKRVETWMRQFSDALEMPELWEDISELLVHRDE